jgi:hypothetical protein
VPPELIMNAAKNAGRTIGVLFLVQAAVAPVVNFVLLGPALIAPPGFLVNAAAHSTQVDAAVLLLLVTGALWVGIAVTALPVIRQYSRPMALWFLALAVICFSGVVIEGLAVRSMLALSQEYAKADPANVALFQAAATTTRSLRNSAHYTNLLVSGAAFLVLYSALFRFALIPRVLSALGLATAALLIAGALIPLFGQRTIMLLFMPVGLSQLALVSWLLIKGFEERHYRFSADTAAAQPP